MIPRAPTPRIALPILLGLAASSAVVLPAVGQQRSSPAAGETPVAKVIQSALEQTAVTRFYDPAYVRLSYPGGDVPPERGVCADVVVRAFRAAGVDLQKEIHVDMAANFSAYPNRWGNRRADRNIDHRRVPNLMTFFERKGKALRVSAGASDFVPGDVVAWDLGGGVLHIGLVSNVRAGDERRYQVVHHLGGGAKLEDVLFAWRIIGHYRYFSTQN